jgi:glycosyl transferase, family 25
MSAPLHFPGLMVLLINLERSTQRRVQMEVRLRDVGLYYQILPAVDGAQEQAQLRHTVDASAFRWHTGRDALPGEVGCYHSHLQAWQKLIESSHNTLLVLEDDMVFNADFAVALSTALRGAEHWDMLKLAKIRAKQPVRQGFLGAYSLNAYIGAATGFGAYLIHRSTAQRLLPQMLPIRAPIDRELEQVHRHDIRHFGLEPFACQPQDEGVSTITGENFDQVSRPPLFQRWTKYAEQTRNLLGRLLYLFNRGRLFPKSQHLPLKDPA